MSGSISAEAARTAPLPSLIRPAAALGVGALVLAAGHWLGRQPGNGAALQLSLILGALLGFVLQRSRFCFLCIWRDWLDRREADGLVGVLAALAVGAAGYTLLFGAWLPDPAGTRLPPTAHIAPVGPVVLLGGLVFGAGMAISGSCISAHLYRLGEGSPVAPFALIGSSLGFFLGFLAWNDLYLWSVAEAPVIWLPRHLGYGGALLATLALLGAAALWLLHVGKAAPAAPTATPIQRVFVRRLPAWVGGLAVGAIGTAAYLRLSPLGVTAEIGSRTRQAADAWGLLPARLEGLDQLRGCATIVRDVILTPNGLFVAGVIAAGFAAALASGAFQPRAPRASEAVRGLVGGILLGFGAMIGLGCTVGTLLSGIMAGALSGWAFALAMLVGTTLTLRAGRAAGLLPA
jgi:uncharacterized protein